MINDYEATEPMTTDAKIYTNAAPTVDVADTLNGLIQACKDGQNGYLAAAQGVGNSELVPVFNEYSTQRAAFAGVLQGLVRSLGHEPAAEGTFTAAVHRGWMDLKAAITGEDEAGILSECERGEDSVRNDYRDALNTNLPPEIAKVVRLQAEAIQVAHDRIRNLRDAAIAINKGVQSPPASDVQRDSAHGKTAGS